MRPLPGTLVPMSVPLASVIIPVYNGADTIGIQLAALVSQPEHEQCEILVCDNGSSDDTADVVREWQSRHAQIQLVPAMRSRGPSSARNDGAKAARGEKFLFCDADDAVADGWIRALVTALDQADIVVGGYYERDRRPLFRASPPWTIDARHPVYKGFFPHLPAGGSGNMGVRSVAFAEAGGFDEGLRAGEDMDLCWRMQLLGFRFAYSLDAVVAYSPRIGFVSTYRQAAVHGVGDRLLRERYAHTSVATTSDRAIIMIGGEGVERFSSAPARPRWSPGQVLGVLAWRLGARAASGVSKQR